MSRPPNPGRRRLFGSAGATLLLTAAEAGPGKAEELDGELLACCAKADALDTEADTMVAGLPPLPHCPLWTEANRLSGEAYSLREHAIELQARTPAGLQAKARIVVSRLETDGLASEVALLLARDVLGRA